MRSDFPNGWLTMIAIAVLWASPAFVSAHPVSMSRTLVYLARERMTAKIEVFLEDLFLFHNLKPNSADFLDAETIGKGIELHKTFVSDRFTMQGVDGQVLKHTGEVRVVAKIPDEGVPLAELMAHKLTFEMEYELDAPPEFLTFQQRFTDEAGILPSEMNLLVKQENAGVPQAETLVPDSPHTIRFSWDNPPLSDDASQDEWDAWFETQQEQTLGITSYSQVYSFLYIDDYEVRHEILIPLLTLEQSVLLARDDDEFLSIAEQDAARTQVEAFFSSGNPIEVDGQRVKPVVQRCDFFGLDFKDFAQRGERKQVPMVSARVGIILSYPLGSPPQHVQLSWDRFNKAIFTVSMVVFAYEDATRTTLTRIAQNNVYEWDAGARADVLALKPVAVEMPPTPTIAIPVLSICVLLCIPLAFVGLRRNRAGAMPTGVVIAMLLAVAYCLLFSSATSLLVASGSAPQISAEDAGAIFHKLHANVYGAFRYRRENEIYDALSTSIDGELLQDVYLQIQRGLQMQEQGGAISRIQRVEVVDGRPLDRVTSDTAQDLRFSYQCRWHVIGTVEHWGHIHERTNMYNAEFTVAAIDGHWKVIDMAILDEERGQFATKLRKL